MDYTKNIFAGKPADFEVIDVHVHHGTGAGALQPGCKGADIVRTMDRLGMDLACCCASCACSDVEYVNEQMAADLDNYPNKLRGYVMTTPHYDVDPARWFERSKGFIGLKVIPFVQGEIPIDDPRLWRYYEYADRRSLPVLIHTWVADEVNRSVNMAKQYPNARFIIAHSGLTNLPAKLALIEGMKKHDNVVMDTAISDTYDGALEWIVDKVGSDRVLYGSDFVTFECAHILGRVAMSRLTDDEKEKIFSRNAKQWLKL